MNRFDFQKAIYKYAILLSIAYLINLVWIYYFHNYLAQLMIESQNSMYEYISYIPTIITVLFNIAFAILVYKDFKINEIKNPLIVIITLFFGFIGIALFFIQVIYNQYVKKPAHNKV
ncbi:hypothetical protein GCQ56_07500 [Marinifilum sp. N1E240]|uniref:hypothetical protein n=1 Tax=Marinifilum sp. N1E240 TaxID=2608082 RepID=UPI00128BFC29|nr:hypothetical protein [Marinifilum sp. N1E240]MPQ46857.1 hypothetical protein [Marinifilum sp. N1E240]